MRGDKLMTVVLEDQVKTITAEILEQFDGITMETNIEDVVRAVIAQYDISNIARLTPSAAEPPEDRGNDYTAPCN
jgi:hypothetical protein